MPTPTAMGTAGAKAVASTVARRWSRLGAILSRERLYLLAQQGALRMQGLARQTVDVYRTGRRLWLGPVRNAGLVAREVIRLIGQERQWPAVRSLPVLSPLAASEYRSLWQDMRGQMSSLEALGRQLRQASWGQLGGAVLVAGEVISLYYLGKLCTRGTKKTLGLMASS